MSKQLLSRTVTRTYCFEDGSQLRVSRRDNRGLGMGIRWVYSFFHVESYRSPDSWERPGNEGWAWVDAQECADRYASHCGKILKVKYKSENNYSEE